MSAASPVKNGKQPARSTPVSAQAATPIADHINGAAPGGKKKKKKKGKGKNAGNMSNGTLMHHVMDDGDGDMPELEPYKAPAAFAHTRTGLSPDLESVHLSTTASLASLSAARQGADHLNANENVSPVAHAELLTELYRKVGFDAANAVEDEMRKSLDSLPGMRNFVQSALASMAGLGLATDEVKQRTLHAIAQQMLQSGGVGVGVGMGPGGRTATQGTARNGTAHTNGAPPLEPGTLSELALTQALESLVSGKGAVPTRGGAAGQTALHANVVLSHEFLDDEEGVFEDEMYSEDEMDERHEAAGYAHADGTYAYAHGWNAGVEGVYCELEEEAPPGAYPHSEVYSPMSDGMPKTKNKKRRKPEMPDADPDAAVSVPDTCSSPNSNPLSIQQPSAMTPSRNAPPPSSRAAGKQPMAYAPSTPAATTTPANNAPPRSARAAAKAPAPPQTYANHSHPHHNPSPPASNVSAPQKHRPPGGSAQSPAGTANAKSNSKIWSTNTTEERERIKEFWLGLSESERRALVKIEKETVLKRMKEQQKHSCTCAVCGRKRNAIEEELEVLYEAYYEELEQYANYQQRYASSGGTLPPPPGPGPFPGSVELDKNGLVVGPGGKTHAHSHPPPARAKSTNALTNGPKKGTIPESEFDEDDPDGDDYEEEEYDDEEEEDEDDEEEDVDAEDDVDIRNRTAPRSVAARDRNRAAPNGTKANGRDDLFNFGSSLTAGPGNILTVADDLLKNDGQKFLEMMEQLAERRMQREEDAAGDVEDESEEEEEDEGDEEDDGEEDEDEEDEEDEEEALTEEQKMEEGKRMFSIFAARMFEQRVLGAYREKVAQERQLQLLQELAEEETAKNQKEAKKAKENQKKKDKKRQQKMAKEEERAAKAAERAAEEAALKERQQRLEEEQRKKREEERAKREAARKAAEEERQRKEEERRKRLAEEKELQAERERKRKEKEERLRAERKEREEKERKAREEKEAKLAAERAAEKTRKEQQEKEEREKRLAKDKEEKAEREAKERLAREQQQARAAAAKARPPPSPRTNAVASGSSRQQQPTVTPKKILNKPSVQPAIPVASAPISQPTRQPVRPIVSMQSAPSTPQHAQSSQNSSSSPTAPTNVPPPTPTFPQSASSGIPPPMLSPQRAPFPSATALPSYAGYIPQLPVPPPLGPSPIPRAFGTGPPFEPGFGRGLASAAPIGPPKVGMPSSLTSPIMAPGSSAPTRRMSSAADPGPITRPIAPIARPNGVNGDTPGSAPGSGGASPSRRSPSPKGVLGSSALIADDDEVVSAPSRRVAPGPVGQGWHSPRSSVAAPTPWGNAPPGQGFSPSRAMSGGNVGNVMNLGLWGQPPGPGNPNPNANLNDWHSQPGPHFFGASPFMHHSHSTATPPPHSSTGN